MTNFSFDGLTDSQLRLYAVRCVRRVQRLMTDPRFVAVLDVAERHAKGEATDKELKAARTAARDASAAWQERSVARGADATVWSAAWAARGAAAATGKATGKAATDAEWYAALSAEILERAEQQKILDEIRAKV